MKHLCVSKFSGLTIEMCSDSLSSRLLFVTYETILTNTWNQVGYFLTLLSLYPQLYADPDMLTCVVCSERHSFLPLFWENVCFKMTNIAFILSSNSGRFLHQFLVVAFRQLVEVDTDTGHFLILLLLLNITCNVMCFPKIC